MKRYFLLGLFITGMLNTVCGAVYSAQGSWLMAMGTRPQRTIPNPTPPGSSAPPASQVPAAGSAGTQPSPAADGTKNDPGTHLLQALLAGNISIKQERSLGRQIVGNLLGAVPLVKDDVLQRYVNQVGRWVALQSERPDLEWRFGVLDSEDINAFAAPGGYVLVTKGLYRALNNEAELAGVLGHEIGHVISRHHVKLLQRSQLVAAVGGAISNQVRNESETLQNIIGHGAEITARSLDKTAEYEADRLGMVLAARAGYDAYGLPLVLQQIGHVSAGDDRVALLFKTHPHPDERFNQLADAVGARLDDLAPGQLAPDRFYRIAP